MFISKEKLLAFLEYNKTVRYFGKDLSFEEVSVAALKAAVDAGLLDADSKDWVIENSIDL
jgi:hypothetical protein